MPISETSALERVARVLCAQRLSSNGKGSNPSAAEAVDAAWREHIDDAGVVLRTLREPDRMMAAVGDADLWERMVWAALGEPVPERYDSAEAPPAGTDPLHEGP
jgi:hypothetical protein